MPVLQLLSDVHLEFYSEANQKRWLDALDPSGVDVLVLAGDICLARDLRKVIPAFCAKYPQVVYVTGNHEYYKSSPEEVTTILHELTGAHSNLHWLANRSVVVAGLRFAGGTLWFPRAPDDRARKANMSVNDFFTIKNFEPWVYGENQICEMVLEANRESADVIVTHHIPSENCIAPRFQGSPLNHFFCRDMFAIGREWNAALWVFGHTHDRMTTKIGKTTLACNPKGYPHEKEFAERGTYIKRCLIEVSPGSSEVKFLEGEPGPLLAIDRA